MDLIPFYQMMIKPPLPWKVSRVEVHPEIRRVDVWLDHGPGATFACPECSASLRSEEHTSELQSQR